MGIDFSQVNEKRKKEEGGQNQEKRGFRLKEGKEKGAMKVLLLLCIHKKTLYCLYQKDTTNNKKKTDGSLY